MGVPFRRVALPFHWEMVPGSHLGVEDHHPRARMLSGWSLLRAPWGLVCARFRLRVLIVGRCRAGTRDSVGACWPEGHLRVRLRCTPRAVGAHRRRVRGSAFDALGCSSVRAAGPIEGQGAYRATVRRVSVAERVFRVGHH